LVITPPPSETSGDERTEDLKFGGANPDGAGQLELMR
jgi:hypothetical protein